MKDFADVPNSSGTFPDVVAVPCSGPGETDGSAIIADTMTDEWGWKQALLDEVGLTPNDAAEAPGASQILDALQKLIWNKQIIPLSTGQPTMYATTEDWKLSAGAANHWVSAVNTGGIRFPLDLPIGATIDLSITVRVNPGAARTGGNRITVALRYVDYDDDTQSANIDVDYDDGTTNTQDIILSTTGLTILPDRDYFIIIFAGVTGMTDVDELYGVKRSWDFS